MDYIRKLLPSDQLIEGYQTIMEKKNTLMSSPNNKPDT